MISIDSNKTDFAIAIDLFTSPETLLAQATLLQSSQLARGRLAGTNYLTDWERFLRQHWHAKNMTYWKMQQWEPLMEIAPAVLLSLDATAINKSFWITSEKAAEDLMQMVAHFTVARELLRITPRDARRALLHDYSSRYDNMMFCRTFQLQKLLEVMLGHRLCNVNNKHDRGSHRMRSLAATSFLDLTFRGFFLDAL